MKEGRKEGTNSRYRRYSNQTFWNNITVHE